MMPKAKILIVDDNPNNRLSIRTILKGVDAELHEADNGFDALSMVLENDYALILLDVQMPEMDGYEVCEQLRADDQTAEIPVIFLTAAFKENNDKIRGYKAGATDYLTKPLDEHILKAKVHVFLRIYQQHQQLQQNNIDLQLAASVFESQQGIMIMNTDNIIV
jgi:DNA-binding response OmpR family regulator